MLAYVYEQAVPSSGIERHGEKVSRIVYYRMVTAGEPRNLLIYLTLDGRLADYDIVDD